MRVVTLLRCGSSLVAAAALSICLCSQDRSPSAKDSAHDLAQRVDRHYNQMHSLKARFTESYEGLGIHRTESGTLLLLKPGRMKWDYSEPAGKMFLLDGKFAWFYSHGDSQVQRIPAKQLDDLRSPLRFLLGHTELEKEMNTLSLAAAANGTFRGHERQALLRRRVPSQKRKAADASAKKCRTAVSLLASISAAQAPANVARQVDLRIQADQPDTMSPKVLATKMDS